MKKLIPITFFLLFTSLTLFAQENKEIERAKIRDLFSKYMSRDAFRDTNMVYMFALKVFVSKDESGEPIVKSVSSSDSTANLIFKDFDFLSEIKYQVFMGSRKSSTFIFPIYIFLGYPDKDFGFVNMNDFRRKLDAYLFSGSQKSYDYIYITAISVMTTTAVDY